MPVSYPRQSGVSLSILTKLRGGVRLRPWSRFIVHAVLGFAVIAWIVASNQQVFAKPAGGPLFSPLECVYYVVGIASVALGWYFNITYVQEYAHGRSTNPLWGEHGSWAEYIKLMFTNPAAGSASQDYTIANVVLLPIFTIVDGYRRGLRRPWLYLRVEPVHQLRLRVCLLLRHHGTAAPARAGPRDGKRLGTDGFGGTPALASRLLASIKTSVNPAFRSRSARSVGGIGL